MLRVGEVSLNCRSFEVTTPNGSALLTNVQFDLLYHLMSNAGAIFTSQQLLQDVWDYPRDTGSPELVRAHIKNLRDKLEPAPTEPIYHPHHPGTRLHLYRVDRSWQQSPMSSAQVHILVVDDDPDIAGSLHDYLIQQDNYRVSVAADGREAIPILTAKPGDVDLVLLDMWMPNMSGAELLDWIRHHEELKYTRVIVLTAASNTQDMVEALSNGADDYVTKPYYPQELLARVQTTLRTQQLEKQLQRQRRQLAELNRFSHIIVTTLESRQLFSTAVDSALALLDVELAALFLLDEKRASLECQQVKQNQDGRRPLPSPHSRQGQQRPAPGPRQTSTASVSTIRQTDKQFNPRMGHAGQSGDPVIAHHPLRRARSAGRSPGRLEQKTADLSPALTAISSARWPSPLAGRWKTAGCFKGSSSGSELCWKAAIRCRPSLTPSCTRFTPSTRTGSSWPLTTANWPPYKQKPTRPAIAHRKRAAGGRSSRRRSAAAGLLPGILWP
jgi:DNA-binding response OmpR family regulator